MVENRSPGDQGDDASTSQSHDYEYDEAHDAGTQASPHASGPAPVAPPDVDLGEGGDYGYDEARDFGRR